MDDESKKKLLDASESFGSLLMKMQKKEELMHGELPKDSETASLLEQDVVDLDHSSSATTDDTEAVVEPPLPEEEDAITTTPPTATQELPFMDIETAKELDDAVRPLTGSRDQLLQDVQVLPLSPLYQQAPATTATTAKDDDDVLTSQREQYIHRIGRDMRMLALKIVASTETTAQWRLFCQENAGLFPILETIREGARSIIQKSKNEPTDGGFGLTGMDEEETFRAACSACRAVRDLCAISPEQAAVVTDGVLRANAAWKGGLMQDFCIMLRYANEYTEQKASKRRYGWDANFRRRLRNQREVRSRCKLYVTQLLLAMAVASDDAVEAIRSTEGLTNAVLACSSYARSERTRRWLRYPGEMAKWLWRRKVKNAESLRRPFLEAGSVAKNLKGNVLRTSNQVLAAIGYNRWIPKCPGQRGLRILSLDGGGSRGMAAVTAVRCLMEKIGSGWEVADSFDLVAGTSTGGIIAFLTGLRRETSAQAVERYNQLIKQIFVKSALSAPLMLFTTATYDESHFMEILSKLLGDSIMLDSRGDPAVPLVFCVTSKMSSTPTHVSLCRNYNYASGELADSFTVDPDTAREELGLKVELEHPLIRNSYYERKRAATGSPGVRVSSGSRHPGSFRVLQKFALRASTAAPTVFKPVMMGGEIYADGGIVSSNPAHVAIHEARALFPDIPIELVVSIGTGGFVERKSAPRIGWDGIIGQIVNSATDGEQIHHILEDVLGETAILGQKESAVSSTRYYRFNPVIGGPDDFPIDVTDPEKLTRLSQITRDYMDEPEQKAKIDEIGDIILRRPSWSKRIGRLLRIDC